MERGQERVYEIYRNRGRLMKNRGGSWTLTFTVVAIKPMAFSPVGSGYQQLRGKRDDLIGHAETIGITTLYLPGVLGTVPIEFAKMRLDSMEKCEKMFAGISDEELESQWWDTKSFVSEDAEIEHFSIETELDRRKAIQQESGK